MEIKIPWYNVLNMFLTGFVFIGCMAIQHIENFIAFVNSDNFEKVTGLSEMILLLIVVAGAYEVGLILNRIGSVVFEPLLIKMKIISYDNRYKLFQAKARQYPIMSTLSREYALSRTGAGEFLILSIFSGVNGKGKLCVVFGTIMLIYLLSCRKHANKIVDIMKEDSKAEEQG